MRVGIAEQPVEIARGTTVAGWTFNGRVPGPIRAQRIASRN